MAIIVKMLLIRLSNGMRNINAYLDFIVFFFFSFCKLFSFSISRSFWLKIWNPSTFVPFWCLFCLFDFLLFIYIFFLLNETQKTSSCLLEPVSCDESLYSRRKVQLSLHNYSWDRTQIIFCSINVQLREQEVKPDCLY